MDFHREQGFGDQSRPKGWLALPHGDIDAVTLKVGPDVDIWIGIGELSQSGDE